MTSGEAFAVDVGRSRVAVHGTHLRVSRNGDRIVVDLNEGVVSVGDAPRAGSTVGTMVTAPAHIEFQSSDVDGTLTITHDPALVRPAASLAASARTSAPTGQPTRLTTSGADVPPSPVHRRETKPNPGSPPHAHSETDVTEVEANPEAGIAAAVRSCMTARPHAADVSVAMSTTLYLDVGEDGAVHSARFEPPVAADVNACAAPAIYKARFARSGQVNIPIDVKVPSSAP